jgi:divalent metal cation (Fe/Co/Zn/Cd) transporter
MALTAVCLAVMPLLGVAKRRLGARRCSATAAGEGGHNLLCAYIAAAVLVGLAGNVLVAWWWLDPTIGLLTHRRSGGA